MDQSKPPDAFSSPESAVLSSFDEACQVWQFRIEACQLDHAFDSFDPLAQEREIA